MPEEAGAAEGILLRGDTISVTGIVEAQGGAGLCQTEPIGDDGSGNPVYETYFSGHGGGGRITIVLQEWNPDDVISFSPFDANGGTLTEYWWEHLTEENTPNAPLNGAPGTVTLAPERLALTNGQEFDLDALPILNIWGDGNEPAQFDCSLMKEIELESGSAVRISVPQRGEARALAVNLIGEGNFVKDGGGLLELSGDQSGFAGNLLINDGGIVLQGEEETASTYVTSCSIYIETGAELDLTRLGQDVSIGPLNGHGTVHFWNQCITFDVGDQLSNFSGRFAGTGELWKTGTGLLTLSGFHRDAPVLQIVEGSVQFDRGTIWGINNNSNVNIGPSGILYVDSNVAIGDELRNEGVLILEGGGVSVEGDYLETQSHVFTTVTINSTQPSLTISQSATLLGKIRLTVGEQLAPYVKEGDSFILLQAERIEGMYHNLSNDELDSMDGNYRFRLTKEDWWDFQNERQGERIRATVAHAPVASMEKS